MALDSKIIRSSNIEHLEGQLDRFMKSGVIKQVLGVSSHEAYGDHIVVVLYDSQPTPEKEKPKVETRPVPEVSPKKKGLTP